MNKYKFYIYHNSSVFEVFPLFNKMKFSWKKDGVRYRKECKTEFTFINDPKNSIQDFTTLLSIENGSYRCLEIEFKITRSCDKGITYSDYWEGIFSVGDGKFNLNECTFKFTPPVKDKYSCVLKNFNKEFNLVVSGPLMTIRNYEKTELEFMYCPLVYSDPAPDPSGPIFSESPVCLPNFPAVASDEAAWHYLYSDIVDLGGGDFHGNLIIYCRWVRTVFNVGGIPNTPPAEIFGQWWEVPGTNNGVSTMFAFEFYANPPFVATYGVDIKSVNCGDDPGAPFNLTGFKIIDCYAGKDWYYIQAGTGHTDYTQFRTLQDGVAFLLSQVCSDTNLVSDFFEWNPIGDAPGYVAGKNYVTGDNNVVAKMAIAQKSDVIDPAATQHATIGMISLKSMLENLGAIFNIDWDIDSNGNFRIEHVKYFSSVLGYNTTVSPHSEWNKSNNKYIYKKESMPSEEHFEFMESFFVDFIGKNIIYNSACVTNEGDGNIKNYIADKITTDVDYIELYPSDLDKHGFVLVTYSISGAYNVIYKEVGKLSMAMQNNGHLSWANLHYNYHRYNRVILNGNMNGNDETFFTAIKNKVQENVKLVVCCGEIFDPTKILIQTGLGQGEVESAEEQDGDPIKVQINL